MIEKKVHPDVNGITQEMVLIKLNEAEIQTSGSYIKLPDIILDAIDSIQNYGNTFEQWEKTTKVGSKIKNIIKKFIA